MLFFESFFRIFECAAKCAPQMDNPSRLESTQGVLLLRCTSFWEVSRVSKSISNNKSRKNCEETRCRFPSCFIDEFEGGGHLLQKHRHISLTFLFQIATVYPIWGYCCCLVPIPLWEVPIGLPTDFLVNRSRQNHDETRCCLPRRFFQEFWVFTKIPDTHVSYVVGGREGVDVAHCCARFGSLTHTHTHTHISITY